jgi:hypothetical protein
MEEKGSGFQGIFTGDDSWFFLYYLCDSIWAASRDDELPQRIRQKIDTEKCLISILWSVNGIYSLLDVFKGRRYKPCSLMLLCPV